MEVLKFAKFSILAKLNLPASSLIKHLFLFVFGVGDVLPVQGQVGGHVHDGGRVLDVILHTDSHMELANA